MKKIKNLTMAALRQTLSRVFFGDADEAHVKYIIPLSGNWLVPTSDPAETISTWIGFQIVWIRPIAASIMRDDVLLKNCKVSVRLWATGEQAEEFIASTLFWDEREDVKRLFDRHLGRLIEGGREVFSQVYEQEGLNNALCWITDVTFAAYVALDRRGEEIDGFRFEGSPHIRNLPESETAASPESDVFW
jgi:hypothetical protein